MRATLGLFGLVVLVLVVGPLALSVWLDARWFAAQGLFDVFTLRLSTQLVLALVATVLAAAFIGANLLYAASRLRRTASKEDRDSRGMLTILGLIPLAALLAGIPFGLVGFAEWQTWLGFRAQVPFGQSDPSFGQDIAFYLWTLPALAALKGWLTGLIIVAAIGALIVYAIGLMSIEPPITSSTRPYPFVSRERDLRNHPLLAPTVRHVAALGAVFLVLVAASYWLNNWELVYSNRGVVYGASATDMHAVYPANEVLAGVAVILALVLLFVAIRPSAGITTGFLAV